MNKYSAGVGGNSSNDEQEIEGDDELQSESLGRRDRSTRDRDSAGHEGMEDPFQSKRRANGPRHLSCHVAGDLDPREVPERREGNRERRIEVGPGDVARRQYHSHHRQSCARRVPYQRLCSAVLLVHDRRCRRHEYQDERPYELRS